MKKLLFFFEEKEEGGEEEAMFKSNICRPSVQNKQREEGDKYIYIVSIQT